VRFREDLKLVIENALKEDIGSGDYTSLACVPKEHIGKAKLIVKDTGIIAGIEFAKEVFSYIDPSIIFNPLCKDGDEVHYGDIAFYVSGSSQKILQAERLVLNAMQRMSAIATKTASYMFLINSTKTQIIDTRKTTPGIRVLEKWAVRIGGGENHRFGLYDMMMLKDNHIDFCGGITKAVKKAVAYKDKNNLQVDIIVEARDHKEVAEILQLNTYVRRILLDNFTIEETLKAVDLIGTLCETESSGNITEKTILQYANCGVNYISVGALTHSVYNMDLSLKAF
jgi:nicotinate-nucleotide pyrophosphorylase (carboxylating)